MLCCVYIDKLLLKLSAAGVGCYMGSTFVGALAYADDIVLICPTPSALRLLLKLCDDFACEYDVMFNANKSRITDLQVFSVFLMVACLCVT